MSEAVRVCPEVERLGSKAAGLLDLCRLGVRTPSALVVNGAEPERSLARTSAWLSELERRVGQCLGELDDDGVPLLVSLRLETKAGGSTYPTSLLNLGIDPARAPSHLAEVRDGTLGRFERECSRSVLSRVRRLKPRAQVAAMLVEASRFFADRGEALCTTVVLQRMVFGWVPLGLSGMAYTSDPHDRRDPRIYGRFQIGVDGLTYARDDESGKKDLAELEPLAPDVYAELTGILSLLEEHYAAVRYVEYTVERSRLYLLQNTPSRHDPPLDGSGRGRSG